MQKQANTLQYWENNLLEDRKNCPEFRESQCILRLFCLLHKGGHSIQRRFKWIIFAIKIKTSVGGSFHCVGRDRRWGILTNDVHFPDLPKIKSQSSPLDANTRYHFIVHLLRARLCSQHTFYAFIVSCKFNIWGEERCEKHTSFDVYFDFFLLKSL